MDLKTKYIVCRNDNGTEYGLIPQESWDSYPVLRNDVDDKPLSIVMIFFASCQEEANKIYDVWLDRLRA